MAHNKQMLVFISPAKKMQDREDSLAPTALPHFLPEAKELSCQLASMDLPALQKLYKCSDSIAQQNYNRLQVFAPDNLALCTPAILSYQGIQYQYMSSQVLTAEDYAYLQDHLFILSGLYGLLRPFDGVRPYRLEMQARLKPKGCKDLYAFWQPKLTQYFKELEQSSGRELLFLDLSSNEYSKVLPADFERVEARFCIKTGGRLLERGTLCKMARGAMVKYLAEHKAQEPACMEGFAELDFAYDAAQSNESCYTFVRPE